MKREIQDALCLRRLLRPQQQHYALHQTWLLFLVVVAALSFDLIQGFTHRYHLSPQKVGVHTSASLSPCRKRWCSRSNRRSSSKTRCSDSIFDDESIIINSGHVSNRINDDDDQNQFITSQSMRRRDILLTSTANMAMLLTASSSSAQAAIESTTNLSSPPTEPAKLLELQEELRRHEGIAR